MQICALEVQIILFSRRQQDRCQSVDQNPDPCRDHDRDARRGGPVNEFLHAFPDNEHDCPQQDHRIEKSRKDCRLPESVGEGHVGAFFQQEDRRQRNDQAPHITQIVTCVSNESD